MEGTMYLGCNKVVPYVGEIMDEGANNLIAATAEINAKDFVRGYEALKITFGRIPTEKEFWKYMKKRTGKRNAMCYKMVHYYEAVNWFYSDPWGVIDDKPEALISRLTRIAEETITRKDRRRAREAKKNKAI